jgi:hypothetical protein
LFQAGINEDLRESRQATSEWSQRGSETSHPLDLALTPIFIHRQVSLVQPPEAMMERRDFLKTTALAASGLFAL